MPNAGNRGSDPRMSLTSGAHSTLKNIFPKISVAALIAQTILPQTVTPSDQASKTFRQGAYTAEQASRGERIYATKCSMCHGESLGGVEMAPALAGTTFRQSWERQPLLTLATRIRTTM